MVQGFTVEGLGFMCWGAYLRGGALKRVFPTRGVPCEGSLVISSAKRELKRP